MEKLQLGRKRKTDAEKPRMDPLMRALKALAQRRFPGDHDPEELEHQRRNQEILGPPYRPPWRGWSMKSFPSGPCLLPGTRLKTPHGAAG